MFENRELKNKFLMPAEWERHYATWLAWPNDDDYFGNRIKSVEKIYLQIISALHKDEFIKLLVLDVNEESRVRSLMSEAKIDLSKIIFYHAKYFDVWMRDYGPIFVREDQKLVWTKWIYDGYGKKFPELFPDNEVFENLKDMINHQMINANIVLEGGAIETNGHGTILTTEECLLKNRNQNMTQEENNKFLSEFLGAKNVIWLNRGLLNDHTDGHIDEIARFVSPTKILCAFENDTQNENYERLLENYKILENSLDQDGNKFEIVKLPMPHMEYAEGDKKYHGKQAPVSYANFYISNKTVLVSLFGDPNGPEAVAIIKNCFPDREVVGIDCQDLIYGGGAIHCITQQEPES